MLNEILNKLEDLGYEVYSKEIDYDGSYFIRLYKNNKGINITINNKRKNPIIAYDPDRKRSYKTLENVNKAFNKML